MNFLVKLLASFFFIGYIPKYSATLASFIVVCGIYLLNSYPQFEKFYFYITTSLFIVSLLVAKKAEEIFKQKDSPKIVIDDIVGLLVSFIGHIKHNNNPLLFLLGFLVFRFFDGLKIFPTNYIHEKLNKYSAVCLDDLIVGIYTNIILRIIFLKTIK